MMKIDNTRLKLILEFEAAPNDTLFSQVTVAAIRQCSIATMERDRWAGGGIPYLKIGRQVRYRKADIKAWLDEQPQFKSTAAR